MRRGTAGGGRRLAAGLLALVLLLLSAAPGLAAPPSGHAMQECGHPGAAAPSGPGEPGQDRHGAAPVLACCIAAQCPMLPGGLPASPVRFGPSAGSGLSLPAPARGGTGIELPPALPPRAA